MPSINEAVETLRQNKRECCDGMRAYHESEIAHKGHAVEVLNSIMTATLTIYGGLVATSFTEVNHTILAWLGVSVMVAVTVLASVVILVSAMKIRSDNVTYEKWRRAYLITKGALEGAFPPGVVRQSYPKKNHGGSVLEADSIKQTEFCGGMVRVSLLLLSSARQFFLPWH